MKISYNWLKDYADLGGLEPGDIASMLTSTGLEVEGLQKFESVKGGLEGIIIGEVIACDKHPDADKLSLTKVDIGSGKLLSVVCGAPNVAKGQKVLVATVGTTLTMNDEPVTIMETRIRGALSEGMICAEDEIGLGTSHEGIMVLEADAPVGKPAKDHFEIAEDWVFEIGLTPNRTDATSHIGVARDLVAALNQQRKKKLTLRKPSVDDFTIARETRKIDVIIMDTEACPRYTGLTITNVHVKESPVWLKNRLSAVGIRPINNIVDITNYILMETGQPLHAFDADRIKGDRVVIRKAKKGEHFLTLDEVDRELLESDLMICDVTDAMCIAGVFGGIASGVIGQTRNIFLESAYFHPGTIRKTAKHHNLQTDASFRFERGADPNMTVYAIKRAATMIKELAGGMLASEIVDVYPKPLSDQKIRLIYVNMDLLIGQKIPRRTVKSILNDLEIKVLKEEKKGIEVSVPTCRHDVRREADLIEEILRIYGYNNVEIGEKLNSSLSYYPQPDRDKVQNVVADMLSSSGFNEIMNNSLTRSNYASIMPEFPEQNNVMIFNPLSTDLNAMRQSLLFGALETVRYNQNRQNNDLKMFEFGTVYELQQNAADRGNNLQKYRESTHLSIILSGRKKKEGWNTSDDAVDFFDLKSIVMQVMKSLGIKTGRIEFNELKEGYFEYGIQYLTDGVVIAHIGKLSKKTTIPFEIKQEVFYADLHWDELFKLIKADDKKYVPMPKFPEVRRDLALMVGKSVTFAQIEELIYQSDRKLIKGLNLFDVYEGDKIANDKKSYAVSIILQDRERTLTDKVVDAAIKKIISLLAQKLGASIR